MSLEQNSVLARLSAQERAYLSPRLHHLQLETRKEIYRVGQPPDRVVFPLSGIISIVAGPPGQEAEVGIVGRKEMTATWAVLGTEVSPSRGFVQIPGEALVVDWTELAAAIEAFPAIRSACLAGVASLMQQITDTAWTNARATVAERTARWILLCYERTDLDVLPMTHSFLSLMLGVRRPGVTLALQTLEGAGAIRNTRGKICIRNLTLLEQMATRTQPQL